MLIHNILQYLVCITESECIISALDTASATQYIVRVSVHYQERVYCFRPRYSQVW